MLRRKDSFGFIDFMRGKYSPYNIENIQKIILIKYLLSIKI